jgi:UDP-glucose:(heptosyl)LPS alpha-1,3-glucosyltransferase
MRIAIGIVSLFPGGGLQRDCVDIAKMMHGAGHEVVIYTARLTGAPSIDGVSIIVIPNTARTNHRRQYQFAVDFQRLTSHSFDLVVGFDKLLELDILYCADRSIYYRLLKQPYLRLLPRYRTYARLEGDSFKPQQKTRIIVLSQQQLMEYMGAWRTERERVIELPPTLSATRRGAGLRVNGTREQMRTQLGLAGNTWAWLAIGVQPRTKGLDRVLRALHHFPQATLLIAGLNDSDMASKPIADTARQLGISSRVIWLGHREDIERICAASDLLMHPARYDTTGTVILEALVNGLPVITTSTCGYAKHVHAASAGIVLEEPFDFQLFLTAIKDMNDPTRRALYSESGIAYGRSKNLDQGKGLAAQMMLDFVESRRRDASHIASPWGDPLDGELPDNVVSLPLSGRR